MFIATALILVLVPLAIEGLECYSCTNVTTLASCNAVTACSAGSVCLAEVSTNGRVRRYTLGCKSVTKCPVGPTATSSSNVGIIGRSIAGTCLECCGTGMCNRRLCQNEYTACSDTTDCTNIGSFSNICGDIDHIKNVCRKFCGLCSLVDGAWSAWSAWSQCSITCGSGVITRTHMCNNPAPENGGKACVGSQQESQKCIAGAICSVAGGWGAWSSWSSCSASCDIGLQARDRSCSNPAPAGGGAYCVGATSDNRICFPGACADGRWSPWGSWGNCMVTCGEGLRTRSRTCNNPAPSLTGRYCVGNQMQNGPCNIRPCMSTVAFTTQGLLHTNYSEQQHIVYKNTIMNVGAGYNNITGYFTAPVSGTYLFTVHVCSTRNQWFEVLIVAAGTAVGSANYYNKEASGSCSSGTGVAVMARGDRAWVQCSSDCNAFERFDIVEWNSFAGVFIGP